jgi:hypothetical protein
VLVALGATIGIGLGQHSGCQQENDIMPGD